jgi:four helix bundle protein
MAIRLTSEPDPHPKQAPVTPHYGSSQSKSRTALVLLLQSESEDDRLQRHEYASALPLEFREDRRAEAFGRVPVAPAQARERDQARALHGIAPVHGPVREKAPGEEPGVFRKRIVSLFHCFIVFMEKKFLGLRDIDVYRKSLYLSNEVWSLVQTWNIFSRDTVGKQFVRSVDSISANIAEGFGRFHKRDKIHFYRYAYGSVQESMDWTVKARMRKLISEDQYEHLLSSLKATPYLLHQLISFTNSKLKQ